MQDRNVLAISLVAALILLIGAPMEAFPSGDCKSFRMVKGSCEWVTGELFIYNGWPPNMRIVVAKTKQIYGVGPGAEQGLMPSYLKDALIKSQYSRLRGQYEICPFGNHFRNGDQTSDEPDISDVCVQSAKELYFYTPNRDPKLRKWVAFPVPKEFTFVGVE